MPLTREQIIQALRAQEGPDALAAHALADVYEKGGVDHLRLVRVERMLEFLLSKQVVEIPRKPTEAEYKAFADAKMLAPAKILEQRTWLDEFNAWYADFIKTLQTPSPAAPAAEGDRHAQA